MAPRPKNETPPTAPSSYPQTTPPSLGADLGAWVLNAVTKLEGTTGKLDARLDGIEQSIEKLDQKLDRIEAEVRGHGNWMHTLKAFAAIVTAILGWTFVYAVWPWLRTKLGIPS